jgi:two-component system phosphate regulon sensor histidine kinase PhoR
MVGLLLVLGIGPLVGWFYDAPLTGLLAAALLALAYQVRQLLAFDRALHTRNFDAFRYGEGVWQKIYSRLAFERERGNRYKRQYRRLLKEIRKSTDAMPDGAIVLDRNNEIVASNRAATELAGLKRKKDRGQRVDNIVRDPGLTRLLQAGDADLSVDIASPVQDGNWLNCRVVPYGAEQKLLLLRDVTERIVLNKMRRDFVANASHELRSPLTVISGYIDSLVDDPEVSPELRRPLQQMQSQARRMTTIINELLELSRLEGAARAAGDDEVDVVGLLRAARQAYAEQPDAPGIELRAESVAKLRGNRLEIDSVINNLLSNAVRHTPPDGKVVLTWRAAADGAELIVGDTGEGIAQEHIPRLTERFFRVDRGRSREDGGVGLGLSIVKHVLGRHDAQLRIESEPGTGSKFICEFPARRVVAEAPVPIAGASDRR